MPQRHEVNLENILKEALDISPDCFGVINQNDVVIYCNNTFASIFGITKNEVIGKTNAELLKSAWHSQKGIVIATDDFDSWYQKIAKVQKYKLLNQFETDLTDGRWFKMTRVRIANGYTLLTGVNVTDLKKTQASLEKSNKYIATLANTDQLTGLKNRRAFNLIAKQEIKNTQRYQHPLSLILIDIDYFKRINDNYGHESGDYVLQSFASACEKIIRCSDSLCRIGGEEFTVLLPMANVNDAYKIAEQIRSYIETFDFYLSAQEQSVNVTVSIGISHIDKTEYSIKKALARADIALYRAKKNGRNQVVQHVPNTAK